MHRIKQVPEDFVVIEDSLAKPGKQGRYAYFRLWKREYTTMRAAEHIAQFARVPLKDIGFAGAKDKEAVTEQTISIRGEDHRLASIFQRDDLKLTFLGYGDSPISLGDLHGNRFEIIIRNLDHAPAPCGWIINYFDDQRFSENNALVGKAMLQGKWDEACAHIKEPSVKEFLEDEPKNYNGALHTIPLKILQLYIHAYQSLLFNQAVNEYLHCKYPAETLVRVPYTHGELAFPREKPTGMRFPIVGFGVEYPDKDIKAIYERLLQRDGLNERSFIVRAFPELSAEGDARELVCEVQDLEIGALEGDDLNPGKKKCKAGFFLQKGSYATLAIKRMMAA
jgi:tRNA pseudouridine13 synthase